MTRMTFSLLLAFSMIATIPQSASAKGLELNEAIDTAITSEEQTSQKRRAGP